MCDQCYDWNDENLEPEEYVDPFTRVYVDGWFASEHADCSLAQLDDWSGHGRVILIGDFVVEADHRGQGYGRRLMDTLIERADERGIALALQVWTDNAPAVRLYSSAGFVVVKRWTSESGSRAAYSMVRPLGGSTEMSTNHNMQEVN